MKKVIFILISIFIYTSSFCQIARPETNAAVTDIPIQPIKKVDYSFSTGTSFSMGSYKSSSFYAAPQLTYQLTPKFKLKTGIVFINSNIMVPNNAILDIGQSQNQLFERKTNETVIYASGDYRLNDKFIITGSFMKNFNSPTSSKLQETGWRNSFQMMSMGFQYKITPKMTLGAEVKVVQGDNLYNNPLYYNMYQFGTPNPGF